MKGYEYVTSFLPFLSDDEYERMIIYIAKNFPDASAEYYESQHIGDYYLEFVPTGHERDSSGDQLIVWKKLDTD
jgi:hypothetical protein